MAGTGTETGTEMNGNARAQKSNCLWPADGGALNQRINCEVQGERGRGAELKG